MAKKPNSPAGSTPERSGPAPRTDWYERFLTTLRTTPVVRTACLAAGVGRSTAYDARQRDEDFALAWAEAVQEGVETLEQIAWTRAREGQPLKKTTTKTYKDAKGKTQTEVTVTEERHISDTVLLRVLSRFKPEYRDSSRHEVGGPGGGPLKHEITADGALEKLYDELERLASSE